MRCEVEVITYWDHSRKIYVHEEGWLKRATEGTLTITSIGAVVFENEEKLDLVHGIDSEKVEIDEILVPAIIKRKKLGKVDLEMIE